MSGHNASLNAGVHNLALETVEGLAGDIYQQNLAVEEETGVEKSGSNYYRLLAKICEAGAYLFNNVLRWRSKCHPWT